MIARRRDLLGRFLRRQRTRPTPAPDLARHLLVADAADALVAPRTDRTHATKDLRAKR